MNHSCSQAAIIVWDYEQRAVYAQLQLHKAKVEALDFSPNDEYLVSLGGQDDGRYEVFCLVPFRKFCFISGN